MAACSGRGEGDACTVQRDDKTFDGTCHALPGSGVMVCFLPPPPPLQAAVDACSQSAAGDACSFTWDDHTINGACRAAPDGTLVCAPACRRDD
ncbi:MAG TPA: hypothetical protein VFF02_12265 [Anaeromyxobacteraceae bacterium]|nr:hypothetical protein [Anaeromyxobacteraceae bacterium]